MERYVIMKFRPGTEDSFLEIFNANKEKIAAFEGCTYLELRRSVQHPSWFMTYSLWDEEKFLDRYRYSDLFKIVWGKVKPLFADEARAVSVWPEKEEDALKRENFLQPFGEWSTVWKNN